MTTHTLKSTRSDAHVRQEIQCAPPSWLTEYVGASCDSAHRLDDTEVHTVRGSAATLVTVVIPNARGASASRFAACVRDSYDVIRTKLSQGTHSRVVRMWNHLPGIHDQLDDGRQRYMAFNAGRHAAFTDWLGSSGPLAGMVPAATGVGHGGHDLVIHALAVSDESVAIENPSQVPSYRYSSRWGPLPPCFSRATLVRSAAPMLLVSGTAAVLGEESVCDADVAGQLRTTLENLRRVVLNASAQVRATRRSLGMTHLRVYAPDGVDQSRISEWARGSFDRLCGLEVVHATLCRPELLIEAEGVATLVNETGGTGGAGGEA